MRILILSDAPIDVAALRNNLTAKGTSGVYAANLARELLRRGIDVECVAVAGGPKTSATTEERRCYFETLALGDYDHAIGTEQNTFERRDPELLATVRRHVRGKICTIFDHDKGDGGEDLVLHARRPTGYRGDRARWIGWAADADLFYPEQSDGRLTVLVDHKYHPEPESDRTEQLLEQAQRFCADYEAGLYPRIGNKTRAQTVFLGPSGPETLTPPAVRHFDLGTDPARFMQRLPQHELAALCRSADLFVVTHRETMGLSVLETALSGALVIAPHGYVEPELLRPLHHLEFEKSIDWAQALAMCDARKSVDYARVFTWQRLADRLLAALEDHESGAETFATPADWRPVRARFALRRRSGAFGRTLVARRMEGQHQFRIDREKPPWPVAYTLEAIFDPQDCDGVTFQAVGPDRWSARVEVVFDFDRHLVLRGPEFGDWRLIGGEVRPLDGGRKHCILQFLVGYASSYRLILGMRHCRNRSFKPAGRVALGIEDVRIAQADPLLPGA